MKCEHCGINEATFYCKTSVNGRTTQTHLCRSCAQQLGYTRSLHETMGRGMRRMFDPFSLLGDFGMMPTALLSEFPAPDEAESAPQPRSAPQQELVDEIEKQQLQQQRQRNALQSQLRRAVEEERYEDAARLRDELRAL